MLQINFNPFPIIETERLVLRRLSKDDVNEIIELRGNPDNMIYIPRPLITNQEEALAHFKVIDEKINSNEGINWAVTEKGNPKMLGLMGLYQIEPKNFRAEIGYMILPQFNGKGYTTEAVKAIVSYGFDVMQLHSIQGVIDPRNLASERILQKNGFIKEAHLVENEFAIEKFWDTVIYSLLKRNFKL